MNKFPVSEHKSKFSWHVEWTWSCIVLRLFLPSLWNTSSH